MVDDFVDIPLFQGAIRVRVIALHRGRDPGDHFTYLQGTRSGLSKLELWPEVEARYLHNLKRHVNTLSFRIRGPVDAVASPPSDHAGQAEPYRSKLTEKFPDAVDLTCGFERPGEARAGAGATLREIYDGLSYRACGCEGRLEHLVIVDDTFTTGTTVGAIILRLRDHGLPIDCNVTVACPLWLDTKTSMT